MINIGIIGAGYWGPNLIRNFNSLPNCNVKYVADLIPDRLQLIKENFQDITTTDNYKDILSDSSVEAVVIATPVATHSKLGEEALNSAKHVFIEKPFTTNTVEAEKLIELAEKEKRVLMVGHLFEYHPAVIKLKEIIDSGNIGDIYYIDIARLNLGPPATTANVIWDLAPHDISILLYLINDLPEKVSCVGGSYKKDQWVDLIQAAYITLQFSGNRIAQIHNSWLSPAKTRKMMIFGSKGMIVYDEMADKKIAVYGEGEDLRKHGGAKSSINLSYGAGEIFYPEIPDDEPLKKECEHFINCIIDNEIPKSDGIDGLNVIRIIEKANASIVNK